MVEKLLGSIPCADGEMVSFYVDGPVLRMAAPYAEEDTLIYRAEVIQMMMVLNTALGEMQGGE